MIPLLTLSVVGYNYKYEWVSFIHSMLLQHDDRWFVQLLNDGPDPAAREICAPYVEEFPHHFSYTETEVRFDDFGHSLRQDGLTRCETKYWGTNNADNYLAPKYVEFVLQAMEERHLQMLVFPCVHNYANVNGHGTPPYSILDVAPKRTRCDAGTMIIQTSLAQEVGWNHRFNEADGAFIDDVMTRGVVWGQIPNVLMVHN